MHGQLYCGQANPTALFSSLVVSALGSELDDLVSSPGRGKALCSWDVWGKKMRALLSGFAKSIYLCHLHTFCKPYVCRYILQLYFRSTFFSSPVVSALGSESDDPSSSPGQGKVLCPWDVQEKKMQAVLLGLAKSIYYVTCIHFVNHMYVDVSCNFISVVVDAEQSKYYQ